MWLKLPEKTLEPASIVKQTHFSNSDELCEYISELCEGKVILAFSTGKDSVVSWLKLRRYFKEITPVFLYRVPGRLSFIDKALAYYEDFFGCHIYRFPHPDLYSTIGNLVFQPPEHLDVIVEENFYMYDFEEMWAAIRSCDPENLDVSYIAEGIRSADSIIRGTSIRKHGPVSHLKRQFYPIYDYKKDDIVRELEAAKVKLPYDYALFGRTFDGVDRTFTQPIKEHFPDDYQVILDAFPLAEMDILRMKWRQEYWDHGGEVAI